MLRNHIGHRLMPLRLSTYAVQIAELDALGCEVEHNFLNDKIKSVTAYFGLLSAVADPPLADPSSVESSDPIASVGLPS